MPEKFLLEVAHSIGPWLGSVAKAHPVQEEGFFNLCTRILELPYDDKATESDAVTEAINHPVGHVTEALIGAWFAQKPQDKARLPTEFRQLFTRLCDMRVTVFRHARVILAAHVIALFRVDPAWTADNLLPLFEWERNPQEALAVWKGFLWAARLYRPLISTIKVPFLQTASHYSDLGDAGRQYVALLAYSALDRGDTFKWAELATATSILPSEALEETASALALALEGAGEQRAEYWTNRIRPYWHAVWPKARVLISAKISLNLGRLIVAAGSAFPDALRILQDWIVPSEQSHFIVSLLSKTDLCKRYPREALQLLCQIIGADDPWPAPELAQQLNEIAIAWPAAREDDCFRRLENQLRRQA